MNEYKFHENILKLWKSYYINKLLMPVKKINYKLLLKPNLLTFPVWNPTMKRKYGEWRKLWTFKWLVIIQSEMCKYIHCFNNFRILSDLITVDFAYLILKSPCFCSANTVSVQPTLLCWVKFKMILWMCSWSY